jgi:hypothetical protein
MFSGLLSDIRAGVISQMFRARLVSSEDLKNAQAAIQQPPEQAPQESSDSGRKRHKKKSRKRH